MDATMNDLWLCTLVGVMVVMITNICAHLLAMTCIMIKVIVRIPKCVLMATLVCVIWSCWCYSPPQDCMPTFIQADRPMGIWLTIVKDKTVTQWLEWEIKHALGAFVWIWCSICPVARKTQHLGGWSRLYQQTTAYRPSTTAYV